MPLQFKEPYVIKATYRIVTPMFIGDADKNPTDGIRPSSVKGALRFWWRALHWGTFWEEQKGDEAAALKALHEAEARLFGSSMDEKKERSGQGGFLLSIEQPSNRLTTEQGSIHKEFKDCQTAHYLAYGLMGAFGANAGKLDRGCIDKNQLFTVKLAFRGEPDSSVIDALKALGLLGGLGSRSRHGMGSVALEKITHKKADTDEVEIFHVPANTKVYQEAVRSLLQGKHLASPQPPFTAFSSTSRIEALVNGTSPYKVLDSFAEKMLVYRSWGRGGDLNGGLKSDKNFQDDHDWYRDKYAELPEDFHPRRVVFGLPHNYHKETHHVIPEPNGDSNGEGRRASPLLFHVHQIHGSSYVGVAIFLPATFLPDNKKISANMRLVPQKIEWAVITDFLDGKGGKKYFPNKTVIVGGDKL